MHAATAAITNTTVAVLRNRERKKNKKKPTTTGSEETGYLLTLLLHFLSRAPALLLPARHRISASPAQPSRPPSLCLFACLAHKLEMGAGVPPPYPVNLK